MDLQIQIIKRLNLALFAYKYTMTDRPFLLYGDGSSQLIPNELYHIVVADENVVHIP